MINYFFFIVFTVIFNAAAQLLIKKGVLVLGSESFNLKFFITNIDKIIFNPFIILGLICMTLSMMSHIISLSKFELSYAFPFISITYVIVFIGSFYLFNENLSILRVFGLILIILGTMFVAKS